MLKLKNRRKSTLALFSLCLLTLTGCQNKSTIAESEESITEETIDESFLLSLSEEDLELDCDIRHEYISIKENALVKYTKMFLITAFYTTNKVFITTIRHILKKSIL